MNRKQFRDKKKQLFLEHDRGADAKYMRRVEYRIRELEGRDDIIAQTEIRMWKNFVVTRQKALS